MALSIISWNTRNLSDRIARPGIRGRGLELEYRIHCIVQNIKLWKADIVFILEAGPDAENVATSIVGSLSDYQAISSETTDTTAGERYIMVFKRQIGNSFKAPLLVGNADISFRKGWMVPIHLGHVNTIGIVNLVVLHAPSPSYPLETRIDVIKKTIEDAKSNSPNQPIILMGDFNIKRTELKEMDELLHHQEKFQFEGPKDGDSPASTSIRKFTTILMGTGFESSDSQPYDQFWSFGLPEVKNVRIPSYEVAQPVTDNIVQYITDGMKDIVETSKKEPSKSPPPLNNYKYDKSCELYDDFQWFRTLHIILNGEGKTRDQIQVILKDIPITEWLGYINAINELVVKFNLNGLDDGEITLDFAVYLFLKNILDQFVFFMKLANSVINCLTGGMEGEQINRKAIFEFSISDHLPIFLNLPDFIPIVIPLPTSSRTMQD